MKKFITFLSYHNAVPVALGILFLSSGAVFAASPAAQDAVYSSQVVVQSVDNTRIVAADLDVYPFTLTVIAVTEDQNSYYVEYALETIELQNGVWQDVTKHPTLIVSKSQLGGHDLGLYATEELTEVRDHERARLKETQALERGLGESQKVVATVYSGLIGALLDPTTETFPAYVPVIQEPVASLVSGPTTITDTEPPALTLVGQNPTRINLNTTYIDEGVIVTDNAGTPTLELKVDNQVVGTIEIDTSRVWAYLITYTATDTAGNTTSITRDVVIDGEAPAPPTTTEPESF